MSFFELQITKSLVSRQQLKGRKKQNTCFNPCYLSLFLFPFLLPFRSMQKWPFFTPFLGNKTAGVLDKNVWKSENGNCYRIWSPSAVLAPLENWQNHQWVSVCNMHAKFHQDRWRGSSFNWYWKTTFLLSIRGLRRFLAPLENWPQENLWFWCQHHPKRLLNIHLKFYQVRYLE